jgi:NRPS condensation-like uncharacterized protein
MSESASLPTTMPVEFVERTVYMASEFGAYRPQLGGVVLFDGRLDETRLMRALRLLLDAEPVLGCNFVPRGAPPVWRRLDGLDSIRLLDVRESDDPAADAAAFIAEPFDCTVGPQALAALVHGPSSDALAVKVSHVAMDGGALKETLYVLGEFYRTLAEQPDWMPKPNLDGVRAPMARAGLLEKLGSFRQSDMTLRPSDWDLPLLEGRGPATYVTTSVEPDVFLSAAGLGAAAGYYRTLWRLLGAAPGSRTPLMNSCELRKHLPAGTKTALSNISSAWYVSVPPADAEGFGETLARVIEATHEWKRAGAGKASAIGIPIINKLWRRKDLEYIRKALFGRDVDVGQQIGGLTNIGIIDDDRLDYGGSTRVTDAWLLGPVFFIGVLLTATTFRDRLHLAVGAEFAGVSAELVTHVVEGTAREIESWVASRGAQVV